jgi:hypothetical protein
VTRVSGERQIARLRESDSIHWRLTCLVVMPELMRIAGEPDVSGSAL